MIHKLSRVVKILFQRVSVERILTADKNKKIYYDELNTEYLRDIMLTYNQEFSDTEMNLQILELQYQLNQVGRESCHISKGKCVNVFSVLFNYVPEVLTFDRNHVVCRFQNILEWNELTRVIGEDLPVLARLSVRDAEYGIKSRNFSWQPIVGHNNVHLDKILQKGLADNHFHLRGSSAHFDIAWMNLMNKPARGDFRKHFADIETNYRDKNKKAEVQIEKNPLWILNAQAALIRLYLCSRLCNFRIHLKKYNIDTQIVWNIVRSHDEADMFSKLLADIYENECTDAGKLQIGELLDKTAEIRSEFPYLTGFLSLFPDIKIEWTERKVSREFLFCIVEKIIEKRPFVELEKCALCMPSEIFDYLWRKQTLDTVEMLLQNLIMLQTYLGDIQGIISSVSKAGNPIDYMICFAGNDYLKGEEEYRILAGERWFLYSMLMAVLGGNTSFSRDEMNLFYAYVRIKNEIRSELVQSNVLVGFENFQIYQNRKDWFTHAGEWKSDEERFARLAVRDVLNNSAVKFLEVRISPGDTPEQNRDIISGYDNAIVSSHYVEDMRMKEIHRAVCGKTGNSEYSTEERELLNRFYYVFHFTKVHEKAADDDFLLECRHYKYRRMLKRKADAIIGFREQYPIYAQRLVGIDACAMEVGCRPEVFAWIFRELKNHASTLSDNLYRMEVPRLRITYHVGEEFLDIADGLRAIDEAIRFLDMECGDRLGHALALGVDVRKWYEFKGKQITITLQDYLDNIVWLYQSLIKYHIKDVSSLKGWLEKQFSLYFTYIYSQDRLEIRGNAGSNLMQGNFDINTYYFSWLLRGDKPEIYRDIKNGRVYQKPEFWERYAIGKRNTRSDDIRNIPEVVLLYHMYHYNEEAKKRGREEKTIFVTDKYIEGIALVQKAMRDRIVKKGIGIETNPTSNMNIGALNGYAEHPIVTFYNLGLTKNERELMECPQINVSINTDDKGVFATRIENEYALLACALENETLSDGSCRYKAEFVYDWLDNIREMGIRQAFWDRNAD